MDKRAVIDTIRPLKGAPLSILIALLLLRGSMTANDLEVATGYSDKPITMGLKLLEAKGYLQNNGQLNGWSIKTGAQLPLPLQSLADLSTAYPQESVEDRRNSDLLPPPPPYIEGSKRIKAAEGGEGAEDRRNSDLLKNNSVTFEICRQFGVGKRKAEELAALPWSTPAYITAIFRHYQTRDDLTPRNRIAYAIQAISDQDEAPVSKNTCPDCGRVINPRLSFCTYCAVNKE